MRCLGMRLSLAVSVWLLLTSLISPVVAQTKSVVVQRRDAEMTLLANGDVQVIETWEVQFIGGPFTSAFRSIPLNKVDLIDGWGVADEAQAYREVSKGSSGEPYTFEYTSGDGAMKAKWYFPPTTDQTRAFTVTYTLHGALRIVSSGDEFFWKFIERDRQYTIQDSRVTVHLPEGFEAAQLQATTYYVIPGSVSGRVLDDRTIEFAGGPFASGIEWEIRAQFPHGVVTASAPAWQTNENQLPIQNSKPVTSAPRYQAPTTTSQSNGNFFWIVLFLIGFGVMVILQLTGHGNFSSGSSSSNYDWDSSDHSSSSSNHDSGRSSGSSNSGGDGGGNSDRGGGGGGSSGFN